MSDKHTEERTETHACDLISRQEAIDAVYETFCYAYCDNCEKEMNEDLCGDCHRKYQNWSASKKTIEKVINNLPSVQPTLYGYNIEHLELIARVLQKENLPPERTAEVLTDIGRIVAIVRDEFEETLRKAVEQCMI